MYVCELSHGMGGVIYTRQHYYVGMVGAPSFGIGSFTGLVDGKRCRIGLVDVMYDGPVEHVNEVGDTHVSIGPPLMLM